jgi:hypothetical protein
VVNTIEVDSLDFMPGLVDAALGGSIGHRYENGEFVALALHDADVPRSISPRQVRQALSRAGLRDAVEMAVAGGDQDLKDWWAFATEFERHHPRVLAMADALNVSDKQLDEIWTLGAAL